MELVSGDKIGAIKETESTISNVELKTEQELKSNEILNNLGIQFKIDNDKNHGFPILDWQ